jgi:hypothetical protein
MAKFHRKLTIPISDNQGKIPVLEVDVVGALEVIVDRNLLFGVGLTVLQLKDCVLSVGTLIVVSGASLPSELLDRIGLVICQVLVIFQGKRYEE